MIKGKVYWGRTYQRITLDIWVFTKILLKIPPLHPRRYHAKPALKDDDTQKLLDIDVTKPRPHIHLANSTLERIGKFERLWEA